jgi:hypothetical protein
MMEFQFKLINNAREKRSRIVTFFQKITDNCKNWDFLYVLQAQSFKACQISNTFFFLKDF